LTLHGLRSATASYRAKLTYNGAIPTNVSQTQTFPSNSHDAAASSRTSNEPAQPTEQDLICFCAARTLETTDELKTFPETKNFEKKYCDRIQPIKTIATAVNNYYHNQWPPYNPIVVQIK